METIKISNGTSDEISSTIARIVKTEKDKEGVEAIYFNSYQILGADMVIIKVFVVGPHLQDSGISEPIYTNFIPDVRKTIFIAQQYVSSGYFTYANAINCDQDYYLDSLKNGEIIMDSYNDHYRILKESMNKISLRENITGVTFEPPIGVEKVKRS